MLYKTVQQLTYATQPPLLSHRSRQINVPCWPGVHPCAGL